MKIVIAGGTGQIGNYLKKEYSKRGDQVVIISRSGEGSQYWDGVNDGEWQQHLDGFDIVINLAGRTVNCRYNKKNLQEMMNSRVNSTLAIGRGIAKARNPPSLWLQMSTATIYAHSFLRANDEEGELGGHESDVPAYWAYSTEIAKAWEAAQHKSPTPNTRKIAMRTSMVMGKEKGGIFSVLSNLVKLGLGGPIGGGGQYMSWIHEQDFLRALDFLAAKKEISGVVNICSPNPIPQKDFMRIMRKALNVPIGLPATKWMSKLGAWVLGTDNELVLKSRRVIPQLLIAEGFNFNFPTWETAVVDLARK